MPFDLFTVRGVMQFDLQPFLPARALTAAEFLRKAGQPFAGMIQLIQEILIEFERGAQVFPAVFLFIVSAAFP